MGALGSSETAGIYQTTWCNLCSQLCNDTLHKFFVKDRSCGWF
jgi:hypothetical protein